MGRRGRQQSRAMEVDEAVPEDAAELSAKACALEAEGHVAQASQLHIEAAQSLPQHASVQAAFASHFVREHLPALQEDPALCELVSHAFTVAVAAECAPLGEHAVFLSKVVGALEQAAAVFEKALEENPEDPDLRYNYGNFLDQAVSDQSGAAAQYEMVLASDGEHGPTLNNYAALLVEQARNGADVMEKAQELLLRAEQLAPGFPAYNLACIASLTRKHDECEQWLRQAYSSSVFAGLPSAEDLDEDDDLASVRSAPWFIRFLGEVARAQEDGEPVDLTVQ